MRKVEAGILGLDGLQVSGGVRDIAQRTALDAVGISRELVESGELHDTNSRENGLRQTKVGSPRLDVYTNRSTEISSLDGNIEFGASQRELKKHFPGNTETLAKELDKLIGEDPKTTDKRTLSIQIGSEKFDIVLRLNRQQRIWAFHKQDMSRLASVLGVVQELDRSSEFGASQNELKEHFAGNTETLAKELDKLIGEDPKTTNKRTLSIQIRSKKFDIGLRLNGKQRIWAFHKHDMSRLASVLGVVQELDRSSEFGVSQNELSKYFAGNREDLAKKLNELIDEDPKTTDKKRLSIHIGSDKFDIILRLNGSKRIWAFHKQDMSRLASVLGVVQELDRSSEFGASKNELKEYIAGKSKTLAKDLKELIGEDPNTTDKRTLSIEIGSEEFDIDLRLKRGQRIWAFHKQDLSRLASALNLQLYLENRPGELQELDRSSEFGASHNELKEHFAGNTKTLAKDLKALIGEDPNTTDKRALSIEIGSEEFDIDLRLNGAQRIWAFHKEDLSRLASVLNLQLHIENRLVEVKELDRSSEFGASHNELKEHFAGNTQTLAKDLKELIGEDPNTTYKRTLSIEIRSDKFDIVLRLKGHQRIWAFHKQDMSRLASVLGVVQELDRSSEFGASGGELNEYFAGNNIALAKKLKDLIGEDPNTTDKRTLSIQIGSEKFDIVLRLNGSKRIWALHKQDLSRLASTLNLQLYLENRPSEVQELDRSSEFGASHNELKEHFAGNTKTLAKDLKELIGEVPNTTYKRTLSIEIRSDKFDIVLRLNGPQRIWAFHKQDIPRLAKAMSWQLRPQKRPNAVVSRLVERMLLPTTLQNSAATEVA